MTTKSTRFIDPQGRVILPSHIRKALNLNPGNVVSVEVVDGTIRIRPEIERCAVCGGSADNGPCAELGTGNNRKLICYQCAQQIAQKMIQQM